MRGGGPTSQLWSDIVIDAAKNMGGFALTNLGSLSLAALARVIFPNMSIKEDSANTISFRDAADTGYQGILAGSIRSTGYVQVVNGSAFRAENNDGAVALFQSRDSGVGEATTARLVGAPDPYFEATLPMVLLPVATVALPATPVEGMIAYDATRRRLVYRDNAAWVVLDPQAYGYLSANGFRLSPATGTFFNTPERINDNDVATLGAATNINEYAQVLLCAPQYIREFRTYGHGFNLADGVWKLQYLNIAGVWTDWVLGEATRVATWSGWVVGATVVAVGIRIVCTTVDGSGTSRLGELEVKY